MSKIERSKISLNRQKICLSDLIEQLSDIITPQARAAGLRFDILATAIKHEFFYGDNLRITQILLNILSNGIKFTPEGGEVVFRIEELSLSTDLGQTRYRFTVRDTGVGMSEEFLTHIFDPFSRSQNMGQVEGTGLGLSITKGLVDLMGGTISVESRLRQGTTFVVELECEYAKKEDACREESDNAYLLSGEDKIFDGKYSSTS